MYTTSLYYYFTGDTSSEAFQDLMNSLAAEHTGIQGQVTKPGHNDGPSVGSFIWDMFDDLGPGEAIDELRCLSKMAEGIATRSDICNPDWLFSISESPLSAFPELTFDLIRLAHPEAGLVAIHCNTIYIESGYTQCHEDFHGASVLVTEHFQVTTNLPSVEVSQLVESMGGKSIEEIGEIYIKTFVAPLLQEGRHLVGSAMTRSVTDTLRRAMIEDYIKTIQRTPMSEEDH